MQIVLTETQERVQIPDQVDQADPMLRGLRHDLATRDRLQGLVVDQAILDHQADQVLAPVAAEEAAEEEDADKHSKYFLRKNQNDEQNYFFAHSSACYGFYSSSKYKRRT